MSVKKKQELKQLETQVKKIEGEISSLRKEKSFVDQNISLKEKQKKEIMKKISSLKEKDINVSEHAMLRYIERVIGIDLNDIKSKILTDDIRTKIETFGNGTYSNEEFKVIVKDNTIVTVEN